jgi:hypothetical protein
MRLICFNYRFCPKCIAAAAGIVKIPKAAPTAGGLIPPPPGFPALAIGPDGQATPTGSAASGKQPTGDPRTRYQASASSERSSAERSSTAASTAALSTVDVPQATGSCGMRHITPFFLQEQLLICYMRAEFWGTGRNKRDLDVYEVVQASLNR